MAFPKETIFLGASLNCDCGHKFVPEVMKTSAWFIGTQCPKCGSNSRETEYFATKQEAERALEYVAWYFSMLRTNEHIIKDDDVFAELNLKWDDIWDVEDINQIADDYPEAKIRR